MRFFTIALFIALLVLPTRFSHAQNVPNLNDIVTDISPEVPSPGDRTTIDIKSYSTDLNSATIVWLVNGKMQLTGIGETKFSFTVAKQGGTNVTVRIQTAERTRLEKQFNFSPSYVDLVWESNGYVPAFYGGKALFSRQGTVTLTAIPNFYDKSGKLINPKSLIYKWKRDAQVLGSLSGYGHQSLTLSAGIIERPIDITVNVSSVDGNYKGEQSIELNTSDPQILTYIDSPIYGILSNRAVKGNFTMKDTESKFIVMPFYFSKPSKDKGGLVYTWLINGEEREDLANARSVTLRRQAELEGQSSISLRIDNKKEVLQTGSTDFSIIFAKQATTTSNISF